MLDSHGPLMLDLRCDCGYEWTLPVSEFPGRRYLQTCRRPECTYLPIGKRPKKVKELRANISAYVLVDIAQQVNAYAFRNRLSLSKAIETLLTEGLKLLNES